MNLSYDLSKQIGSVISIMISYDTEIIGEIVETSIQRGCLKLKNIRLFDSGSMIKWIHSIEDDTPVDIGLSQNKIFMQPSVVVLTAYKAIFPTV